MQVIAAHSRPRQAGAKEVDRKSVNFAIHHLGRFGVVATGSNSVIWVPTASPQMRKAIRNGKKL
jgi:hypothetical protein